MSDSYFISDLHLTRDSHEKHEAFVALCHWLEEHRAARLILLGDLFHYWLKAEAICRRNFAAVLNSLQSLALSGTELHYFVGNHDFLFRPPVGWQAKIEVYGEGKVLTLGRRRFYVCHGDELCRADWGYRLTKPIIRSSAMEAVFDRFPERLQERIADWLSRTSHEVVKKKSKATLRVSLPYCKRLMERHELDGIVHGHVHKNSLQTFEAADRRVILLSVGPWAKDQYPVWRYREEQDRWNEVDWGTDS